MNKGRGLTGYQRDAGPGSPSMTDFDRMVNFLLCSFYTSSAAGHVLFVSFVSYFLHCNEDAGIISNCYLSGE